MLSGKDIPVNKIFEIDPELWKTETDPIIRYAIIGFPPHPSSI